MAWPSDIITNDMISSTMTAYVMHAYMNMGAHLPTS